jgi:hypothetical protein
LEGLSLTRVLASLRGAREDTLERERAEADAARYRVAEAESRLDPLRREHSAAQARLSQLAAVPSDYAAALDDKERHLRESGDPRRTRLLDLAARTAGQALSRVREALGSAARTHARLAAIATERRALLIGQ